MPAVWSWRKLLWAALLFTAFTKARADILIDSFSVPQSAPGGTLIANVADGSGIIGGERDTWGFLTLSANGTVPNQLLVAFPNGLLAGRAGSDITYDGPDHDPYGGSFSGLGSVDLTEGGLDNGFRFTITSTTGTSGTLLITLRSPFHGSTYQLNLNQGPGVFDVPFSSFQPDATMTYPLDFHNVGYIELHFAMNSGDSVTLDNVVVTAVPEPTGLALLSILPLGLLARKRMTAT